MIVHFFALWQQIYFLFIKIIKMSTSSSWLWQTKTKTEQDGMYMCFWRKFSPVHKWVHKNCVLAFHPQILLWKHPPNSQLLWQCFPGRCRQNFLKMCAFNIYLISQECFTSSVSFLRDCGMTRNVQIYICVCLWQMKL